MTECEKSPDGKHHYDRAGFTHAIHVPNGCHNCYVCAFCGHEHCKTTFFEKPDPIDLPTEDQL